MWMQEWWRRARIWWRRDEWDRELEDEMRLHVELRAQAFRDRGVPPAQAQAAARAQFGNSMALRLDSRGSWAPRGLESVLQDIRFGVRRVTRDRAASLVAVSTLALGIAVNIAMLTVIDRVLLTPAPVRDPERLAWVDLSPSASRGRGLSYPDFLELKQASVFADVAVFARTPLSLGGGTPARIEGMLVSANYFDVLGVRTLVGRSFTSGEDSVAGRDAVVVISHGLWTTHFGADRGIVGSSLRLNGRPFTVIGVAARGFGGLEIEPVAAWLPTAMAAVAQPRSEGLLTDRDAGWLTAVGRLPVGTGFAEATAALNVIVSRLDREQQPDDPARVASAEPIAGGLDPNNRRDAAPALGLLAVVPALVLLVACANVANLLLARGAARRKEMAMRRSLGASRGRLVRQLLVESTVLAAVACGAGILMSYGLTTALVQLAEVPLEIGRQLRPSITVLASAISLGGACVLVAGLAPSLIVTEPSALPSLHLAGLTVQGGSSPHRLRRAFVVSQVAVSFVLVIVATLFLRSVAKAVSTDPGFDTSNAVVLSIDPDLQGYERARRDRFTAELLRRVRALPAVEAAALSSALPLAGRVYGTQVAREPVNGSVEISDLRAFTASVTPGYFHTMRIALVGGRDFSDHDDGGSALVAIVNQTFAAQLWPEGGVLGARFRTAPSAPWREVIGIVRDGTYDEYGERPTPFFYVPEQQMGSERLTLVARSASDAAGLLDELTRIVRTLDPDLPVFETSTLAGAARNAVDRQQGVSTLLGAFGLIALLLAALGLYAVIAEGVSRRTREVAVRMALGAAPWSVLWMFAREGVVLSAFGMGIGVALSLAAGTVVASFLFGIGAADPVAYAIVATLFMTIGLAASLLPARHAASVDPLRGLRDE